MYVPAWKRKMYHVKMIRRSIGCTRTDRTIVIKTVNGTYQYVNTAGARTFHTDTSYLSQSGG